MRKHTWHTESHQGLVRQLAGMEEVTIAAHWTTLERLRTIGWSEVAPVRWTPVRLGVKPPRRCSHVQAYAPYLPEVRAEAIRLARTSRKAHAQIARELGMTGETLRLWLKQADVDAGKRSDGLTSDEQEELRRLRRENRILREERAILKKAAAFFAQETGSMR
jgi:transposase